MNQESHVQKMEVMKMRILRWIYRHTDRDRIRNKDIRENMGVTSVVDKIRQAILRWFEYVKRRYTDAWLKKSERFDER